MTDHVHAIGAFEAKTHLSELLRRAEQGETFVIHRRGQPVARLIPYVADKADLGFRELAASFRTVRTQVIGPVDIRSLIEEGRRF